MKEPCAKLKENSDTHKPHLDVLPNFRTFAYSIMYLELEGVIENDASLYS